MGKDTDRTIEIIDSSDYDEEIGMTEIKSFIEELWNCTSRFLDGIKERLIELGHSREEVANADNCLKIVRSYFKKNSIKEPSKLKDWITKSALPGYGDQSKPNIFKLCFALEMNEEQTIDFFRRSYFDTPFNWKKIDEVVYYFCLKYNKTYSEAQKIISEFSFDKTNPQYIYKVMEENLSDGSGITKLIGDDVKELESTEALLQYISKHKSSGVKLRKTVEEEIERLLEDNKKFILPNKEGTTVSETDILVTILGHDPKESIENNAPIKYVDFPKCVTDNFPISMTLSQLRSNTDSYATRRMLIMLNFFNFFSNKNNEEEVGDFSNHFFAEMNELLLKCGFNELYWRNPFDLLFYYSAKEIEDPIGAFSYLIEKMLKEA